MSRLLKIAAREYVAYVRTFGFWLSMLLMPVVGGLAISAPALLESKSPASLVAVVDRTGEGYGQAVIARVVGEKPRSGPGAGKPPRLVLADAAADADKARAWLSGQAAFPGGEAPTAVVILRGSGSKVSFDYWSERLTDLGPRQAIRAALGDEMQARYLAGRGLSKGDLETLAALSPTVRDYSPKAQAGGTVSLRDRLPSIVGLGSAFLLWMMIFTGAGILLNSVIEEKSNRVLEVLLASASAAEIMFGKILGVAGVTLTVLAVWAGVGGTLLASFQPTVAADIAAVLLGKGLIFYFAFYLIGGYLLYASIFVAVGAFCETTREAQTLLGPVMGLLVIPMVFMTQAIRRPDAPMLEAMSWFPPFTPFLMTARSAAEPPLWEVAGTGLLMAATVAVVIWIAGRAFRAGALSTGKVDLKGLIAKIRGAEG
jgi:ABC-2 type transport system permease protein